MHVVTVLFETHNDKVKDFREAVLQRFNNICKAIIIATSMR